MKKYRWGILSTANIGRRAMIPALKESKMAKVIAVASRESEKAHRFSEELGIPVAYGDYQALLDDPSIDAVYNPLPNHLHKPWSIRAAEAGKHILCEKPLALNTGECREMIAAAKANNVLLMESFMYRHHPRIQAARQQIQSGAVGKLHIIESAFTFRLDNKADIRYQPEMGGGAAMDVGCYCINISRFLAGREPEVVLARAVWASSGVDDQLTAILDFGGGLIAHFDCGFNQRSRQCCIASGTEGFMVIRNTFLPGIGRTILNRVKEHQDHKTTFKGVNEYRLIAEDFMQSIQNKTLAFPPEDAVSNMRVIQALLKSAKMDGKAIEIAEID